MKEKTKTKTNKNHLEQTDSDMGKIMELLDWELKND